MDDYGYVKLAEGGAGGLKVLFVLDFMPSEDLKSGKMLSGDTGLLLEALDLRARARSGVRRVAWTAITFNAFRTIGKPTDYVTEARDAFTARINHAIIETQPDVVLTFGPSLISALQPERYRLDTKRPGLWLGVPGEQTFTYRGSKHTCTICATLSLSNVVDGMRGAPDALGYMIENIANAYARSIRFKVDEQRLLDSKPVLIDTIPRYKKVMDMLRQQKEVAVDTEATSLYKFATRLLTVQFAKCQDYGYVIPIYHKDSPFSAKEMRYIIRDLREFFEGDNDNDVHLYANAQFDLSLMRTMLGVRWFENDLWDVFAGAFALDENKKVLSTLAGTYYYSLLNLCVQHGFNGYLTSSFNKSHRTTIASVDLAGDALRYMAWDCTTLHAIKEQQIACAKSIGHRMYEGVVRWQLSDTLHGYSLMEHTGAPLDIEYLYKLRLPDSPIEKILRDKETELLNTQAARKANAILAKQNGAPAGSIFGGKTPNMLKLSRPEHKDLLFFEVLKLTPVDKRGRDIDLDEDVPRGKRGKIDKAFQTRHAGVKEVQLYSEMGKAKKLRDAYVKSFIRKLGEDEDLQKTKRIRSRYSFLRVVTYRTASEDPNLQNIPSRGELGKHIKRCFIAPPGHLVIKVDYRVHEVRGWGLISFDKGVADLFIQAKKLRDAYRAHPSAELALRVKTEADIHVMNAAYFFRMNAADVAKQKEVRNRVKGVIFGLIYQMSIKSLAASIQMELEDTKKLVRNFTKRFPKGMKWIEDVKIFARKHHYVQAPIGIRRNLCGYIMPEAMEHADRVYADMDRRAVNSPIQGMSAQFMAIGNREIDRQVWEHKKAGRDFSLKPSNSVHDSLENLVRYCDFLRSLDIIETGMTTNVREVCVKRYNYDFVVDLEIDFEIGAAISHVDGWDFSAHQLDVLVFESLLFQRRELGYDMDVAACYAEVFDQMHEAPRWLRKQVKNTGYQFKMTESSYLRGKARSLQELRSAHEKLLSVKDTEAKAVEASEAAINKAAKTLATLYEDYCKHGGKPLKGVVHVL